MSRIRRAVRAAWRELRAPRNRAQFVGGEIVLNMYGINPPDDIYPNWPPRPDED